MMIFGEPTATTKILHRSWKKKELRSWRIGLTWKQTLVISGDVSVVQSKLPKKLKKRKPITREDGSTEYVLLAWFVET
ncbi:hypothetical protein Bca52824_024320 [Brassica carinata]|uniref:Uncharacterized protein n=1 Tax=Brassica carinata TaxID=52824 RepID=A0A8X7VKE6_BRACI|nr:hypothetical protein Bca52824_024320 [Brassica carinata]